MKKTTFLLLLIAGAMGATAQKATDKSAVDPARINKAVVQQQATINPVLTHPDKTIQISRNKLLIAPTTEGKDIRIVIDKIDDLSTNTQNLYTIYYSVINSGTVDVDITNITVQGFFYSSNSGLIAGGGISLTPAYLNGQNMLHSGELFAGAMSAGSTQLYTNASYKFALKADNNNAIAEANENNNTFEMPVTVHIPPPPPPNPYLKPDVIPSGLEVSYNAQTHMLQIKYLVTNLGNGAVDLTKVTAQGVVVPQGGAGMAGCGSVVTSIPGTMLNPNTNYTPASYNCNLTNLQSGKTYRYDLTLSSTYQVPESNTNNNSTSVTFTIP